MVEGKRFLMEGKRLLISPSIGMTATHLAKELGLTVIATTRNASKAADMGANGVDRVVIDDGAIEPATHEHFPDGVDRVLELVDSQISASTFLDG